MSDMPVELDEEEEDVLYDGTGMYSNGESEVWYDTDGVQHVDMVGEYE